MNATKAAMMSMSCMVLSYPVRSNRMRLGIDNFLFMLVTVVILGVYVMMKG